MEDLFNNVKYIHLIYHSKIIYDRKDVEKLHRLFHSVSFVETEETLVGVMGGLLLEVTYEDETVRKIGITAKLLTVDDKTYKVSRNICPDLREIFN